MINGLDLFSGIGGLSLALREWVRPIAYCEIDPYCQGVLLSRISKGLLSSAPIWNDIKTLSSSDMLGSVDVIYGGFPCQDISVAGNGKGLEGERSGLFFEIMRLAKEIKPKFLFLENVPAITSRGGWECVHAISTLGYDCRWCIISAASVGASHKRNRWFLLAHSKGERFKEERQPMREEEKHPRSNSTFKHEISDQRHESPSPFLGVDDVISSRVDRIKSLGNAVVPCQAKEAFKILMGLL